jgi:hypothetical protein
MPLPVTIQKIGHRVIRGFHPQSQEHVIVAIENSSHGCGFFPFKTVSASVTQ